MNPCANGPFVLCINSKQHFLVRSWVNYSGLKKVRKTKEVLIFKSHKLLRTVRTALNKNSNLCNITFSWYIYVNFIQKNVLLAQSHKLAATVNYHFNCGFSFQIS